MEVSFYLNHESELVRVEELDGATYLHAIRRGRPTEFEKVIEPGHHDYDRGMEIATAHQPGWEPQE